MLLVSLFSGAVQLSAPRWVAGRAIALHSSALTGGIAVGAFLWGEATASWGVGAAVAASGIALLATALVGLFLPIPLVSLSELERVEVGRQPEVALQLTSLSGPIVIEHDYNVADGQARTLHATLL